MSLSDIGCDKLLSNMLNLAIAFDDRSSFSLLFKKSDRKKMMQFLLIKCFSRHEQMFLTYIARLGMKHLCFYLLETISACTWFRPGAYQEEMESRWGSYKEPVDAMVE